MVTCSNITCKHRNDKNGKCKVKNITLSFHSLPVIHGGRQQVLKCGSYEEDEEYTVMKEKIQELLGE
jgi:hypothetical protein